MASESVRDPATMPSSVIQSLRYHPAQRLLDIEFRNDRGTYRYFDVPAAEWAAFRAAPSKGTYLNHTFKAGGYGYEKIDAMPTRSGPADSADSDANPEANVGGEPRTGVTPPTLDDIDTPGSRDPLALC